ncbi:MAG: DUF951 domain-containing protein [Eubacteriales bacterium]
MQNLDYKLGDIVMMKKPHPCGSNRWEIVRTGADIKIKCLGENCGRVVMLTRREFNKSLKSIIEAN